MPEPIVAERDDLEEHVKVYLVLGDDGTWMIDPLVTDGYPLDGLEDGPTCTFGHGCPTHTRSWVKEATIPDLPNAVDLYDLLGTSLRERGLIE